MWPEQDITQELIAGAREGNDTALNALLDRHRDSLRRMIEMRLDRKIRRRVDVSDIVQDVLIEANRRLPDYLREQKMPFHLWLRHMARDRIIDAHRRHRRSAKRSVDREQAPAEFDRSTLELAAQLCDQGASPSRVAGMQELAERFQLALEQLEENDREVLTMRHFEQLTNQEVAIALELSEPAASMRYLRALRRLRELIAQTTDLSLGDAE